MEFFITAAIWSKLSQEYDRDLWTIQSSDPFFRSSIKQIGHFTKASLVLVVGLICIIAIPIFVCLDVTYQLAKAFYCTGSGKSQQEANNERFHHRLPIEKKRVPSNQTGNIPTSFPEGEVKNQLDSSIFCDFYQNKGKNLNQVSLNDIWEYSDQELESNKDYMHWLFINSHVSKSSSSAPTMTAAIQNAFLNSAKLQTNLIRSFDRMLKFYGFQRNTGTGVISQANNFDERSKLWMTKKNHNLLRISRILISMSMLGCSKEARALYTVLQELSQETWGPKRQQLLKAPLIYCRNLSRQFFCGV